LAKLPSGSQHTPVAASASCFGETYATSAGTADTAGPLFAVTWMIGADVWKVEAVSLDIRYIWYKLKFITIEAELNVWKYC